MKYIPTTVAFLALAMGAPAIAQNNDGLEDNAGAVTAETEAATVSAGGATGVAGTGLSAQTLVGIGAGVLATGALIAIAADGGGDGVDDEDGGVNMTPTTTTTAN